MLYITDFLQLMSVFVFKPLFISMHSNHGLLIMEYVIVFKW